MAAKTRRSEASSSSSGGGRGVTVVVDWGRRLGSCGYCSSPSRTSVSHGLWAHSITVDDYQDLLDRGWRRSGCFLYKPKMEKTCCPSYTIRLKAIDFVPSREQLRLSRRMQRFLDGTLEMKDSGEVREDPNRSKSTCNCICHDGSGLGRNEPVAGKNEKNGVEHITKHLSDQVDNVVHTCIEHGEFPSTLQLPKAVVKRVSQSKRKLLVEGAEELVYSSNIAFQIAATISRAQLTEKDAKQVTENGALSAKIIAEKLANSLHQLAQSNGLTIRACNGHINFYSTATEASSAEGAQVVSGCEESATGCKRKGCCRRMTSKHPQDKKRRLEIHLNRSSFDLKEFELYRRYQMKVHNDAPDHVTEFSYRRFLVDTPLVPVSPSGDGRVPPCGYGSFHQQYVIDGQLVAVGVVDILPRCLSSKYLFWDPDFAFLSLGKYSALQEIGWVKENQIHCPTLQYYYLGYYIHSCSKMRYKAAYCPSELLCPLRYKWVPFDTAKPLLDRKPYVVLSDFALLENEGRLQPWSSEVAAAHSENDDEGLNDIPLDDDEEMMESEFESSDDELEAEASGQPSVTEGGDVCNILIGLKGAHVRYKVCHFNSQDPQ
uniref:Arginyl-tRNA--protein transferase n=1 Tax=Rhizophora mucronata TaxID=61149 RepID=A0A2P2K3Q5_RHIMU